MNGPLTGVERTFDVDEIIVSKTDLKGIITYTNQVFCRVSQFTEGELLGKPHNIIRHPDMPKCVFSLLWDTVKSGREIFAYVINRTKHGDHYWVFAHVTPTFDERGQIVGYHSNRRVPAQRAVETMSGLYEQLVSVERPFRNPKEACEASTAVLLERLADQGMSYDEFVFHLAREDRLPTSQLTTV